MAFDGCCLDCKLPGDDCPLRVNYGMDGIREAKILGVLLCSKHQENCCDMYPPFFIPQLHFINHVVHFSCLLQVMQYEKATVIRESVFDTAGRSEEQALQVTKVFSLALDGCVLRYLKLSDKAMGEKGVNAFGSLLRSQNTLEEPYLMNVAGLNMYHNMREWHRDVIKKIKRLNETYALQTRPMPQRLMHYELSGGKLEHCVF
ncbi:uncharacterized protein LOC103958407 [Pyrus x bretschneideri]|uniref:uncharacterized protein LOC103958407 n=1 Tax=Pyrus x bretschneideri TaxID=225117 RepID=UPI00202EDD59|nr:uncharacterized protein LOC103958407 [Pyrus x bretschneideri]XP_048446615.1 uncharacterized protein LOC103958407 [Pyrus x bretschneideri]XP_048446616.1 uncharacterized protein LOC103958407 [Pyrus x bretschneideri]XP_048446617.1 uncharacterized protein LOC103958407 [Pyrus x bretschneideri]XP_048446618.1 uncharacterized protein LOC103958407 [Pyrus x bretschneideri]